MSEELFLTRSRPNSGSYGAPAVSWGVSTPVWFAMTMLLMQPISCTPELNDRKRPPCLSVRTSTECLSSQAASASADEERPSKQQRVEADPDSPRSPIDSSNDSATSSNDVPAYAVRWETGGRTYNEDRYVAAPHFASISSASTDSGTSNSTDSHVDLHMYAVFDGHGTDYCSQFASANIGRHIKQHLKQGTSEAYIRKAIEQSFMGIDGELRQDDHKMQAQLAGTTAVVSLVGSDKIYVGSCGDSRAVLCRDGVAVALTDDHKPERPDEQARVEAAGGRVFWQNGYRVMGALSMSRAIGDHYLQRFGVIPDPDVTVTPRSPGDQFLLVASDGLWAALDNQEACDLALLCFKKCTERGASREQTARICTNVLTKLAIKRGSMDNITVVIVDLRPAGGAEPEASDLRSGPPGPARQRSDASSMLPEQVAQQAQQASKAVQRVLMASDACG